jgi:MFS family permease
MSASPKVPATSAAPDPDAAVRRLAMIAAAAALSAWALDSAGATVAVPVIQTSLGISITASQWVLNLPLLAVAGLVTLGGWTGDRRGRVPMFMLGLVVFGAGAVGAIVSGIVEAPTLLFIARFIEGVGAAVFIPASTALLIDVYPPDQRGGATGRTFAITMVVTTFGPVLAGILVQGVGWPWVFAPGLIAATVALVALARVRVPAAARGTGRVDVVGAVLLFFTVATLIDGFMQAGADGLTAPNVIGAVGFGLLLGLGWIVWELRAKSPLLDPRVVRNRAVLLAVIVSFMRFLPAVLGGAFLARYVQEVLAFSPTVTGLALMPSTIATFLVAGAAGKLLDRAGIRPPITVAMGCFVAACATFAIGYANQSYLVLAVGMVLGGLGLAFSNVAQPYSLSAVEPAKRGAIAGVLPLAGQLGNAVWLAVLTALLVALGGSADPAAGQVAALPTMAWAGAAAMLVTAVVVLGLAAGRRPVPAGDGSSGPTPASEGSR